MATCYDLHIAVIGAGMGGLGCALSLAKKGFRHIDVYEAAPDLGFVGAGIQLAPNMIRILDQLGCWDEIYREATSVRETSIRQGSTNAELAHVDMSNVGELYGHPHCAGHRSSLADGIFKACQAEPAIRFHFHTALVGIDHFGPRPVMRLQTRKRTAGDAPLNVQTLEVDVVLGADGIKSETRTALLDGLGLVATEADTGQAAYRIMLTREQMLAEAEAVAAEAADGGEAADRDTDTAEQVREMLALLDSDLVVRWIGPRRHIIAYPVASKGIYNLSSAQPDIHFAATPSATYTTRGSKAEMLRVFQDFCPLVQRMLNMVPEGEVCEWRLRQHCELPTWVHGSVALLGDACHPTLPHLSQGAAMAIEDGAVLAEVLSRVRGSSDIHRCLKTYELLRKDRTTMLVDMAYHSGRVLHLGEGAAREERDRQFAAHRSGSSASIPDKWASPDVQNMIYSYDCLAETAANFDRLYATTSRGAREKL